MASSPSFPLGQPPAIRPPSAEKVTLRVKVDRSRCRGTDPEIEKRLKKLEKDGLTISIAQIVGNANLHFAGAVKDEGEGVKNAQIRAAWSELRHLNMRAEQEGDGKDRRRALRVDKSKNSRETARRSEVLAMGTSLQIGIAVFDRPYRFWSATPGLKRYDLSAKDTQGKELKVEARGRIDGSNVKKAVGQIHKKFAKGDFSNAIGVVVFPRTKAGGKEDIIVVDPDGTAEPQPSDAQFRNLLLHYIPLFTVQGGRVAAFGRRLKEIADSSDQDFANYLHNGDAVLSSPAVRRGRSGFNWKGTRYVGTFFENVAWPDWLTGMETPSKGGVFFWGLASQVLDGFQNGHVADLNPPNEEAIVELRGDIFSIEMPDWSVLVWGATLRDLESSEDNEVNTKMSQSSSSKPVDE
jgi:hypothetical protein